LRSKELQPEEALEAHNLMLQLQHSCQQLLEGIANSRGSSSAPSSPSIFAPSFSAVPCSVPRLLPEESTSLAAPFFLAAAYQASSGWPTPPYGCPLNNNLSYATVASSSTPTFFEGLVPAGSHHPNSGMRSSQDSTVFCSNTTPTVYTSSIGVVPSFNPDAPRRAEKIEDLANSAAAVLASTAASSGSSRSLLADVANIEAGKESEDSCPENRPEIVPKRRRRGDGQRRCLQCGTTNSRNWRKGPEGPASLCNSCGIKYYRLRKAKGKKKTKAQAGYEQCFSLQDLARSATEQAEPFSSSTETVDMKKCDSPLQEPTQIQAFKRKCSRSSTDIDTGKKTRPTVLNDLSQSDPFSLGKPATDKSPKQIGLTSQVTNPLEDDGKKSSIYSLLN
jgi:hypothetical protein